MKYQNYLKRPVRLQKINRNKVDNYYYNLQSNKHQSSKVQLLANNGHLFNYNEIRDQKRLLKQLRRDTQIQVQNHFERSKEEINSPLLIKNIVIGSPSNKHSKSINDRKNKESPSSKQKNDQKHYEVIQNKEIEQTNQIIVKEEGKCDNLEESRISNFQLQQESKQRVNRQIHNKNKHNKSIINSTDQKQELQTIIKDKVNSTNQQIYNKNDEQQLQKSRIFSLQKQNSCIDEEMNNAKVSLKVYNRNRIDKQNDNLYRLGKRNSNQIFRKSSQESSIQQTNQSQIVQEKSRQVTNVLQSKRSSQTNLTQNIKKTEIKANPEETQNQTEIQIQDQQKPQNIQETSPFRYVKKIYNPYQEYVKEQERILQQRKEAIIRYSKISSTQNQNKVQALKYVIKEGNNHQLIQRILALRMSQDQTQEDQWVKTNHYDSIFNFKWQPLSSGIKYDLLSKFGLKQLINHIEGHENLTTKDLLFTNLKLYCEGIKSNVYEIMPITFILDYKSEFIQTQIRDFVEMFKIIDQNIQSDYESINLKLQELQSNNDKYSSKNGQIRLNKTAHDHQNMWLLKPTGLNRGRGIHIFRTLQEFKKILLENYQIVNNNTLINQNIDSKTQSTQLSGQSTQTSNDYYPIINQQSDKLQSKKIVNHSFVVQKYIERPLLFKQRKFDIRVWALISFDKKCYQFKEGYIRTSCEDYSLDDNDIDKIYVHLTNNAIQKNSDNYGKFEDGNQISIKELALYLAQLEQFQKYTSDEIQENLNKQMREQILISIKVVQQKLVIRKYAFELIGYDFIIDEDLKIYFIEVNTNPCLEESSNLLKSYLPRMIDDLFRLVVDDIFPPLVTQPSCSQFNVEGYESSMNMWEHIYNLQQ